MRKAVKIVQMKRVERIPYLTIRDACCDGFVHEEIGGNYSFIDELLGTYLYELNLPTATMKMLLVNEYGSRVFTPYFAKLWDKHPDDEEPGDKFNARVAKYLYDVFNPKWLKIAETLAIEYDPIHNYLDEWEDTSAGSEETDSSNTRTNNLTNTRTDNLTSGQTYSNQDSGANNIFGFNSNAAIGADTNSGTESGNSSTTNTGTQTNASTGTITDALDKTVNDTRDRSGVHRGNIGNITSQKMINEELEIRKNILATIIVEDCVNAITIPVYF